MSAPDTFALMMDAKQRMEDADRAFSAALQARYGSKAGDVRYNNARQTSEVLALGMAYRAAAAAWMRASEEHRARA